MTACGTNHALALAVVCLAVVADRRLPDVAAERGLGRHILNLELLR